MISAEDLKRQARRHEAAGRFDRAVECYERALERLKAEGAVESTVDSSLYLSLADLHFRQGDVDSALDRYRAAADQYARLGLTQNAVSVHKMSRRLFPDRAAPYLHLAEIYLRVDDRERAREQVRLLAERMEGSGGISPSDVVRTASRVREGGSGEGDPRPGLVSLLEEEGCLPEEDAAGFGEGSDVGDAPDAAGGTVGEDDVSVEEDDEPVDEGGTVDADEPGDEFVDDGEFVDEDEPVDESGSSRESRLMEDLESLEEIGRMMREETSVEHGDEERRGEDGSTEISAAEADGTEREPAAGDRPRTGAEDAPAADAGEEDAPEATGDEAAAADAAEDEAPGDDAADDRGPSLGGWDFLAALRSARRSRPSRPGKSDREEEPEYAGSGPKSEWEQDAEEPVRSEEPVNHGEPPHAAGPSTTEEGSSDDGAEDAGSPRTWKEEIEEELAEPTPDADVEESDKPGLQSAAPVGDGSIRRSRRWNWPPSETAEGEPEAEETSGQAPEDAEASRQAREPGDREYEPDPRDGVDDGRWSVEPPAGTDAPVQEAPEAGEEREAPEEAHETPEAQETPEAHEAPEAEEAPEAWEVPEAPEADEERAPEVEEAHEAPEAEEAHELPGDELDDREAGEAGGARWEPSGDTAEETASTPESESAPAGREEPERVDEPERPERVDEPERRERPEEPRPAESRRPAAELRAGLEVVREMLDLRPGSPELLRRKAAYARRLGDESLLVESWLEMARTLRGGDGSRGARLLALRVLEMDPDSPEAREILLPVDRAASTASAEEGAGPDAGLDPDAPDAEASLRRRAAREFTEEVGAFRWLEAATEVSLLADESLPDDFFHYYGRYLMTRGRWEDAAVMLERAAGDGEALESGDHPELLFNLALIYRRLGRHDRAVRCFRRLAEAEESFATAWRSLPESGAV